MGFGLAVTVIINWLYNIVREIDHFSRTVW